MVGGNVVEENTESTEERALDVDDVEDDRLLGDKSLFWIGISAYVMYSSAFWKYDKESRRIRSFSGELLVRFDAVISKQVAQ